MFKKTTASAVLCAAILTPAFAQAQHCETNTSQAEETVQASSPFIPADQLRLAELLRMEAEKPSLVEQVRQQDTPPPSSDCLIKGNIAESDKQKSYWLPGCGNYERIKIDPNRGEEWFCSIEGSLKLVLSITYSGSISWGERNLQLKLS